MEVGKWIGGEQWSSGKRSRKTRHLSTLRTSSSHIPQHSEHSSRMRTTSSSSQESTDLDMFPSSSSDDEPCQPNPGLPFSTAIPPLQSKISRTYHGNNHGQKGRMHAQGPKVTAQVMFRQSELPAQHFNPPPIPKVAQPASGLHPPRYVGAVLRFPLNRVRGRCTKIATDTNGDGRHANQGQGPASSLASTDMNRETHVRFASSLATSLMRAMQRASSSPPLAEPNRSDSAASSDDEHPTSGDGAPGHSIQFSKRQGARGSTTERIRKLLSPKRMSPALSPRASEQKTSQATDEEMPPNRLVPRGRRGGAMRTIALKLSSDILETPGDEAARAGSPSLDLRRLDSVSSQATMGSPLGAAISESTILRLSPAELRAMGGSDDRDRNDGDVSFSTEKINGGCDDIVVRVSSVQSNAVQAASRRTNPLAQIARLPSREPARTKLGDSKKNLLEADDDGTAEKALRTRANAAFYLRMGCLAALLIPDAITFIVFQVAWSGPVFLCETAPMATIKADAWRTTLDRANLGVLATIVGQHMLFLLCEGWRAGFLAFMSIERQGGWSNVVWNALYMIVVLASIGILAADVDACSRGDQDFRRAGRIHQAHLLIHLFRCVCVAMFGYRLSGTLRTRLQSVVSMNKRRFVDRQQRLDLDLSYICDRLIAMSLPCVSNAVYRNDIRDVARFFASRHYGHFVVVNLCNSFEEGGNGNYDPDLLYTQVQRLPMHDHHAPFMQTLVAFLEAAVDFLNQSRSNVLAVHCRGGKGRTGTFVSALMLWVGTCHSAEEAMRLFARRRTCSTSRGKNLQGVDAPCQKRYLKYLELMIYNGVDALAHRPLILSKVVLQGVTPAVTNLCIIVEEGGNMLFDSGKAVGALQPSGREHGGGCCIQFCLDPVLIRGDVTVRFFLLGDDAKDVRGMQASVTDGGSRLAYFSKANAVTPKGRQIAFASFHTSFHDGDVVFQKHEVDGAYQDRENRFFLPDFSVHLSLFHGSHQHAMAALKEQHVFDASVQANFEVTGRMPPAIDVLRTEQRLDELMLRLCAEEEVLEQGQTVFDSRACGVGHLCYIVAGQVSYEALERRDLRAYGKLGISGCPVMGTVGAGSLLGMLELVLGSSASPFGTVYTAKSDVVTVRRFVLPSSTGGPSIPPRCPAVSTGDLEVVFKKLATSLSAWSASLAQQLAALAETSNCVKREVSAGMEMAEKTALVDRVQRRYQIPITERVIELSDAVLERDMLSPKEPNGMSRTDGHLLLFRRWLIFVPTSSQHQEVLLPVNRIAGVKGENNKLAVCCDDRTSNAESSDAQVEIPRQGAPETGVGQSSSPNGKLWRARMSGMISPLSSPAIRPQAGFGMHFSRSISNLVNPLLPNPRERRRSVHTDNLDSERDHTFAIVNGSESAWNFQQAIQKLKQANMEEQLPPQLLGSPTEIQGIMLHFALHLPGEELCPDEARSLAQLMSNLRRKTYTAGTEVFAEGDVQQVILFVLAGTLAAHARSGAVLATFRAGEFIGERSFWGHGNRGKTASVSAETDAVVLWLDFESVEIVSAGRPSVAARFARCLCTGLARRIAEQLQELLLVEEAISTTQDLH